MEFCFNSGNALRRLVAPVFAAIALAQSTLAQRRYSRPASGCPGRLLKLTVLGKGRQSDDSTTCASKVETARCAPLAWARGLGVSWSRVVIQHHCNINVGDGRARLDASEVVL